MDFWVKRKNGPDAVVSVIHDLQCCEAFLVFNVYSAFEEDFLGRILFDDEYYWIYDGEVLTINEQEQLARVIGLNLDVLWSS
jgi:hypothetical protein